MTSPESDPPDARLLVLGDADFDAALSAADRPMLVDFHATWCPPCRALAPVIERLAESHADHLRVASVDVDASPALVERFGIASVPTLLLLRADTELDRLVGEIGATELASRLERHLGSTT